MSGQADHLFNNWIKGCLGLKHLQQGLRGPVESLIKQHHKQLLDQYQADKGSRAVNCTDCSLQNLKPEHERNRCIHKPKRTCFCNNPAGRRKCPNNFCSYFYDLITLAHDERCPTWLNSDPSRWYGDHWSVAQCFVSTRGYEGKSSAAETDASGLLSVMLNNIEIQNRIDCQENFRQARITRNEIVHTIDFHITYEKLNEYIDQMIAVLRDKNLLEKEVDAQTAVKELEKLKGKDLSLSTEHVSEILDEVIEKMDDNKQVLIKMKRSILCKRSKVINEITLTKERAITKVKKEGKKYERYLNEKASVLGKTVENLGKKNEDILALKFKGHADDLYAAAKQCVDRIESATREHEQAIALSVKGHIEGIDGKTKHHQITLEHDGAVGPQLGTHGNYFQLKREFQAELVNVYKKQVVMVSPSPAQPEKNQIDIKDVYVVPWMTAVKRGDDNTPASGQLMESTIKMTEIFSKESKPVQCIYILGEAGSGKSAFCKSLVSNWCVAHAQPRNDTNLFESVERKKLPVSIVQKGSTHEIVEEMRNFEFLFYIPLRDCTSCKSILMMLKKMHPCPILEDILRHESEKCLILLDGLEDWTPLTQDLSQFQTEGVPARDLSKEYSIITTSSPWKFHQLRIKDSDVDQTIKLRGISSDSVATLIEKTVAVLNDKQRKNKVSADFKIDLQKNIMSGLTHVPMILQELICQSFDENLRETSKCTECSSMLNFFFKRTSRRELEYQKTEGEKVVSNDMSGFKLPGCLNHYEACYDNDTTILGLSRLAFETLSDTKEKTSLPFTSLRIKQLNIPNDVVMCGLRTGILFTDRKISALASRRQEVRFSFIDISIHEFLAAVYVAAQFIRRVEISASVTDGNSRLKRFVRKAFTCSSTVSDTRGTDICKQCVLNYFENCKTAEDILEKSNVFSMLCGLEPQFTRCVSEFIYNIVKEDKRVKKYRTTLKRDVYGLVDDRLTLDIQTCVFSCFNEAALREKESQPQIYLGDLIIRCNQSPDHAMLLDKGAIIPKTVRSLNISDTYLSRKRVKYLTEFEKLRALRYAACSSEDEENGEKNDERIAEIVKRNMHTLECLDLDIDDEQVIRPIIRNLSDMRLLVSLHLKVSKLPHEDCLSLSTFLSQYKHLEHVSIHINCTNDHRHMLDLSKNRRIKYMKFVYGDFCVTDFSSENLITCALRAGTVDAVKQICSALQKASKLKHLELITDASSMYEETDVSIITDQLVRVLPLLSNLASLILWDFAFADTEVLIPPCLKNLKQVELENIKMKVETWCKFTESLTALPEVVQVRTHDLVIHSFDEETMEAARQWVRDNSESFSVIDDDEFDFNFTTKKIDPMASL